MTTPAWQAITPELVSHKVRQRVVVDQLAAGATAAFAAVILALVSLRERRGHHGR